MHVLPLKLFKGHLFVELEGELWLLDTGAPGSFGTRSVLSLAGKNFKLGSDYLGLTPTSLSVFLDAPCAGLLGADVLGAFDHILEPDLGRVTMATGSLEHNGTSLPLNMFMGIPLISAVINGIAYQMFFDTGAQLSYCPAHLLTQFPAVGKFTDFYPGLGTFTTETYQVPISMGSMVSNLRCGMLPRELATALSLTGAHGIIGNEVLQGRTVGYFPRRRILSL